MGILPAIVAAPRRSLRVLIVSDSILNTSNWRAQLSALTGLPTASIDVCVRAYGGAQSPAGMAQLAADVAAYGQSGNILRKSGIGDWGAVNLTRVADTNPITGHACTRVTGTGAGTAYAVASIGSGSHVTVPTGAPPLTFSVEITRGTFNSFELLVRNETAGSTVISQQVRQTYLDANTANGMPTRYAVTALSTDGVGYAAGNSLTCYLYCGNTDAPNSGTAWVREPLVNVGIWPLAYSATSGTAETPAAAAWVTPTPAIDPTLFDLVIVSFGPNDQGAMPSASYEAIMAAMARGATARGVRRVLLATPPPLAASGLSSWDGTQVYDADGYRAALLAAGGEQGGYVYDAWTEFQSRVTGGSNTVANLMRDTVHPNDSAVGNAGIVAYATEMVRRVGAPRQGAMPGNTPFVRLGAESASGGWAPTRVTQTSTSPNNDLGSLVSAFSTSGFIRAYASTAAGTLTITTPACEEIGLLHLVHPTAGGVVDVSVDGGAAVTVNTTVVGVANNYGRGTFIAGGLSRATHTVEIEWVSGTPAIVGVSGC